MNNNLIQKEKRAIEALRAFEPENEPYYLCYSGGKDSDCIRILAELAGVKNDIVHNLTTVDAPETIAYIKSIPNVNITKARWNDGRHKTMWNLIPHKKLPPTRIMRYCCSEMKEQGGKARLKITGVRKAESFNRSKNGGEIKIIGKPKTTQKFLEDSGAEYEIAPQGGIVLNFDNSESRRVVEHCFRTTSTMIQPILDWTDDDVWEFLHHYGCQSNPLYQCGRKRIGCVGCPLQGPKGMKRDFELYPKFRDNYIKAFDRMIEVRRELGLLENEKIRWNNGRDVMVWWLGDDPNQLSFFDE